MRFGDAAAHRMALLAMGQFGIALAARSEAFMLAASHAEMNDALSRDKIAVWLPEQMVLADSDIPACWDVTSDSLAAWLAARYGARRLLLVKSRDLSAPCTAQELARRKIVDPMFPCYAAESNAEVWLAGPASLAGAASVLRRGGMPGCRVGVSRDDLEYNGRSKTVRAMC